MKTCKICGKDLPVLHKSNFCSAECEGKSPTPLHGRYTRRLVGMEHPLADENGTVLEAKYQYYLAHPDTPLSLLTTRRYVIYHINGRNSDNHPENLALLTAAAARKLAQNFKSSVASPVFEEYALSVKDALAMGFLRFVKGVYLLRVPGEVWPNVLLHTGM